MILGEPACYVAHRAAVAVEQMGMAKGAVFYPTHGLIDPNSFGLALRHPAQSRIAVDYIKQNVDDTPRRPWVLYALATVLGLLAAGVARAQAWLILALLAGAYGYAGLLFVAGPAADARYIFPSNILCLLIATSSLGLMMRPTRR